MKNSSHDSMVCNFSVLILNLALGHPLYRRLPSDQINTFAYNDIIDGPLLFRGGKGNGRQKWKIIIVPK